MNVDRIPQLGPAVALVQLLTEYPELPVATWTVEDTGSLHGHLHSQSFAELDSYAALMGGSVRPGRDYEFRGQLVRPHRLATKWRDVEVSLVVVLPVGAELPVAVSV